MFPFFYCNVLHQKIVYIQDVVLCNGYQATTTYNLPKLTEEDNFKCPTKLHTLWANSENKNCNFHSKNKNNSYLFSKFCSNRWEGRDVI